MTKEREEELRNLQESRYGSQEVEELLEVIDQLRLENQLLHDRLMVLVKAAYLEMD